MKVKLLQFYHVHPCPDCIFLGGWFGFGVLEAKSWDMLGGNMGKWDGQFNMDQGRAPGNKNQTPFRYPAIYGLWMSMVWILDSATASTLSTLRLGTGENRGWLRGVLGI